MKHYALLTAALTLLATSASAATYDVVINNGRVMDPETKFDGVRNVGIKNGKIVKIWRKVKVNNHVEEVLDTIKEFSK